MHADVFAHDHHPIFLPALARLILDFRHVFSHQNFILEGLLDHDLLLVAKSLATGLRQYFVLGQSFQSLPGAGDKLIGDVHQLLMGIDPQDEFQALLVPAIQIGRVREVGVPADRDAAGHFHHQINRAINPFDAPTVAGRVCWTIDQVKHFFGIGQRHQQRPVSPDPFIRQSDALLTFSAGPGNRSIHVNKRFLQKSLRLYFPYFEPRSIEAFLQRRNVRLTKAPREISGRRRIGYPFRSQSIQEHFILPAQFNIFQPLPSCYDIVGDVQHMVALVVRQVDFEQLQVPIQILHQPQTLHHQMYRSNPTAVHSLRSLRHLIDNVTGFEHRTGLIVPVLGFEPTLDSVLAIAEDPWVVSIHSKWPFVGCCGF